MGTRLFGFIYKTMQKRTNDPKNRTFWLPSALQGLDKPGGGGKLLPIQGNGWELGSITGNAGTLFQNTIKGQWWLKIGRDRRGDPEVKKHQPIACPNQPWPRLDMPAVTVYGLDNVGLLDNPLTTQPGTGYSTVMTLQFGYYNGQNGGPILSQLHLEGQYALSQCVCSAPATSTGQPAPTACDGWIPDDDIRGTGNFKVTLTGVYVDALVNVSVSGTGSARTLELKISEMTMRGADGKLPDMTVDQLTLDTSMTWISDNIWLPKAKDALTSEDGRKALLQNISSALNQPGNRQTLEQTLSKHFSGMLDSTLGAVPPGTLPSSGPAVSNPADQYLFDRVRASLNNAASDYYLPKVVSRNADPTLEPYRIDSISLGDQSVEGLDFRNLQLHQMEIKGLSNIAAPADRLVLQEAGMDGTLLLSTLDSPPQVPVVRNGTAATLQVPKSPLTITGQFSLQVDGDDEPLGGSFTIHTVKSTVLASMFATGGELAELDIQFTKLHLDAALGDIKVDINIDSAFRDIINEVFNQDDIKRKALDGINEKAAQNLGAIGRTATDGAKKVIAAKLDA